MRNRVDLGRAQAVVDVERLPRGGSIMKLVRPADHAELSCLVVEHTWRVDNGRADTVHELYVDDGELLVGPTPLRGREAIREWGRRTVNRVIAPTIGEAVA
jgi:hypothetical protein